MSTSSKWELKGFPDRVGGVSGEVEKAYTVWRQSCEADPKGRGVRLQGDGTRYTAEVPNAVRTDGRGGWKLMCDYEALEPDLSRRGHVVFVEIGWAPGDVLTE